MPPADWRPGADADVLRARAAMLADIRKYFSAVGVLEVETPLACRAAGTDPAIDPLIARYTGPLYPQGVDLYLQTSPEFAMKRLLAHGSGPIYQICKAFRDGEAGRLHNPEFSILEWYRPGYTVVGMMTEVAAVLRCALHRRGLETETQSYAGLFASRLGIDVFAVDAETLSQVAVQHHLSGAEGLRLDRDGWLDLLMSHLIQPALGPGRLCFITDYPASQAALARRNPDRRTAARFEVFLDGVELANGFDELTDADEQAARFEAENRERQARGKRPVTMDRRLLAAMQTGLPNCCGVAVGLDRLLMLRQGLDDIDGAMSFSLRRC
ncbi:MAG: EF-P lysine aminoacylase EpmA [Sedimenticolaceae bacterium]